VYPPRLRLAVFDKPLRQILPTAYLLVLCASAALCAPAQQPVAVDGRTALAATFFQHIARDRELPEAGVPMALAQDAEGFMWIGTQNGLARWDGYRFRTYRSEPASPGALPDNVIQTLYTDSRGSLWIGTLSAGLARYDRDHDRFVRYPIGPSGLSNVSIRNIADDEAGGVWVATEGGLDHVSAQAGTIRHLRHDPRDPHSLPDDRISVVLGDRDGTLWVATFAAGLVRRRPGERDFIPVPVPTPDGKAALIHTLFEDTQRRVWIGTERNGAYLIAPGDTDARQVLESGPEHSTLSTEKVYAITEARPGEIWLGTQGDGIVVVDTATFGTHRIQHNPLLQESLADDIVNALFKDRSGLVWVGTQRAISVYDPGQAAVDTIFGASSRPGLAGESVMAILPRPGGSIWLGIVRNGIDVLDPAGVTTALLRPDPNRPQQQGVLPRDSVLAFARAESGDTYVGTGRGVYRVDPPARQATRLILAGHELDFRAQALLLQPGVLWVGGPEGLWEVELGSTAGAQTTLPARNVQGLSDQRVTVLERGPAGSLWIGTRHGLNHFDPASASIERILPDATDPSALTAGFVSALLTDRRGRLWVGTYGGGIDVLEGRDPNGRARFHHLGVGQGLTNESIDMLLADSRGRIWASTDNGLASVDPDSLTVQSLRRAEGVAISNYWQGAGAVTADGELVFGAINGLTVVHPDRLKPWSYQPPVVVTDAHIGGKWVPSSYLNVAGGAHEPLTITPGANSIAVEFAALDYSAPERNRYAYQLEGFDANWMETDSAHRLAAYTNLPPGNYRLHLRGSNRDGLWSDVMLTVPVRVLPAWFQTLAFRLLAGVAALGLLVLAYRLRIRYLAEKLQERHLGRLAERDRIARELHDTLLQSTEGLILKVHSVVGQLSTEDPRRALLTATLDRASELAYEGRERIQGLRGAARPRPEIGQVLEKVAREMVQGSATRLELELDGRVRELRPYVWEELYRIGYEALWNAYRHAHANQITVSVSYGDRELLVRIGDNGAGIAPEKLHPAGASGHFGLAGMRERARDIEARLCIESGEGGRGTRVEIRINSLLAYAP
jgi:ligand-binding sensor domain-containing protein/signal transduction histidine kinase